MRFIDSATIWVKAGDGGHGSVHFRREKYVPRGGPDGGDGGRGGSVYLVADPSLNTLWRFQRRRRFVAEPGGAGHKRQRHGKAGADLTISVPPGTVVYDVATNDVLADLTAPKQPVVVARGGRGGLGNRHFATPTYQSPHFAQQGEPGEARELRLELKLLADVGLVGKPNAGKSTLLAVVSAARPKIADYPFTTLEPLLGVATVDDTTFVVADLPGLIAGAHQGVGLGHEFLRHVERTRLLLHVVDASGQLGSDPVDDFHQINAELAAYDPKLGERPQVVVANKLDLPDAAAHVSRLTAAAAELGAPLFALSAATREGVRPLLQAVAAKLQALWREPEPASEVLPIVPGRPPLADGAVPEVARDDDGAWRVSGRAVERAVAMTDLANDEAVRWLQRRFEQLGVTALLARAGVQPGETVRIGAAELEWLEAGLDQVLPRKRRTAAARKHGGRRIGQSE